jgi:hypothetical protein
MVLMMMMIKNDHADSIIIVVMKMETLITDDIQFTRTSRRLEMVLIRGQDRARASGEFARDALGDDGGESADEFRGRGSRGIDRCMSGR